MNPKLTRTPYRNDFYGGLVAQVDGLRALPSQIINTGMVSGESAQGSPLYRFGGMVTYEKPILEFPPDITMGASETLQLTAGDRLPRNCVGIRFINLVGTVFANINGGGPRQILNNDVLSGCEIRSIFLATDVASAVTIQAVGTGD